MRQRLLRGLARQFSQLRTLKLGILSEQSTKAVFLLAQDRARIVSDCRTANDAAPMSSTISARFRPGAPLAPLFFVFAVFGRADGQRAIRAVSVYNTRASIRPSVFGGAHAFSC